MYLKVSYSELFVPKWVSELRLQYLHLAVLMFIGEDVAVDVSERRNPGENRRIDRHVCRLQLRWGVDVCGLKARVSHTIPIDFYHQMSLKVSSTQQ